VELSETMANVIPPEVPGPVAGAPGHFPHHDWLTASVKALDAYAGIWQPFTPTLTATTTNPTLGTGSAQVGRYVRIGNFVHARASIRFGTTGTGSGVGTYQVGMPTPCANGFGSSYVPFGYCFLRRNDGTLGGPFVMTIGSSGDPYMTVRWPAAWPTGGNAFLQAGVPWAWTAGDRIEYFAFYEPA
jgi:hypothetical protein